MLSELFLVAGLFAPILVGLLAHGIAMRTNAFPVLAHPIDRGRTLGGKAIFGANKTYRGIVMVGIGTAIATAAEVAFGWAPAALAAIGTSGAALFGFAVGAAAMLSELPNSFAKRRLNIQPGTAATGWLSAIWWLIDQSDVMLGGWIVASFIVSPTLTRVIISIVFFAVVHQLASWIGFALKMRKSAR